MNTKRFFLVLFLVVVSAWLAVPVPGVAADSQVFATQAAPTELRDGEFQSLDEIAESVEQVSAAITYTASPWSADIAGNTKVWKLNSSGDSGTVSFVVADRNASTAWESGCETITVYVPSPACGAPLITQQQTVPYQSLSMIAIAAAEMSAVLFSTASEESLAEQAAISENVLPAYSYLHLCEVMVPTRSEFEAVAPRPSWTSSVCNGTNGGVGWGSLWLKT